MVCFRRTPFATPALRLQVLVDVQAGRVKRIEQLAAHVRGALDMDLIHQCVGQFVPEDVLDNREAAFERTSLLFVSFSN